MADSDIRYYILFETYEHGLALHDLLSKNGIKNRIAPAPRAIQGKLSCGMSLLIEPEHIEATRECIALHKPMYYDIVPLTGQIKSHRDKYC
ncbi:MAG: DUF3343 domain-containing protein [Ruminococcaceae bacterium]|nr:DUF3343 domain-containing protein [Oscillospiraceae bacterium]